MDAIDLMRSVNETVPLDAAQATDFIHRLDDRHQELNRLLNAVTLGTAKAPDILVEAYNLAVQYRVPMGQSPSTITNHIFMANHHVSRNRTPAVTSTQMNDTSRPKKGKRYYNCGKPGHINRDCRMPPKQKQEVVNLAFRDGDVVFVTGSWTTAVEGRVLLDNQATVSVFRNAALLRNIREGSPVQVNGINGSPIRITQEGDSEMFGTVLYHPAANVNVLSMSVVSKFGRVVYSQDDEHLSSVWVLRE